jgi:DNA-directed RNA polymerase subunit RPC12/RpoP
MQQVSTKVVPDRFITCSKSIVLECRCGEKLILLGREADWRKEGHTVFLCSGCGKRLSLADSSRRRRVLKRIKV